ncbi:MAG: nucleoid-associated protein [Bacteroidota bacterium]
MFDLTQARLTTLAIHKVGNKVRNEGVIASKEPFQLEEDIQLILQDYFLNSFKAEEFFKFTHESDLAMNPLNRYVKELFSQSKEKFVELSIPILNHLYDISVHPHIKGGELYVAHFRECEVDGQPLEAIGIFKSEFKEVYLKFEEEEEQLQMQAEQGVPVKKLDKGCLIFNTYGDDGFSLLMLDRNTEDTHYWMEEFLQVSRIQDNSYQTQTFLNVTKDFCDEILASDQDRKDQLVFLNRSMNYFSKNDELDVEEFKQSTLELPQQREAFDHYLQNIEDQSGFAPASEGFPISKYAVRQMRKEFKSIIKLDNKIEIKLNSRNAAESADFMERGYDEQRGMYFYKIFFNEEED